MSVTKDFITEIAKIIPFPFISTISTSSFLPVIMDCGFDARCREEAQRAYEEERRKQQDKKEYQREKMRENIRQKYGIEKPKDAKGKSSSKKADPSALEVSSILHFFLNI